jgi:hypothetical protein
VSRAIAGQLKATPQAIITTGNRNYIARSHLKP